jgi:hypothetical protein
VKNNVTTVRQACEKGLRKLQHYFEPGVTLTLVAHVPGKSEAEFVLGPDNFQELRDVFARAVDRQQVAKEKHNKTAAAKAATTRRE